MNASHLIEQLAQLYPVYDTSDLLRLALLLSLQHPGLEELEDGAVLQQQCNEIALQLSASSDQHAAVADELDSLAATSPCDFSPDHLWTLIRAIKVQSQILNLYLGPSESPA
ncbi:hypothetical protein [Aureliella helgolandensis]|uniref:Uncharacterized protein n=1 Tax=Aureliella helgolandensis TaxID=2527968 RepID=A0A518GEJ6_9BACT|nr:hypothetical protein [Aureliella helgolandensis]QDV27022.1 hypothetical protein Q31a_54030 [Aureliella helgolandensis]